MKLEDNSFILRGWSNQFSNALEIGDSDERISMYDFCTILKTIVTESDSIKFTIKELQEKLKDYNIFWNESYCHVKFNNCPMLTKEIANNRAIFTIDKEYKFKENKNIPKLEKLKFVIIDIINTLGKGKLPLNIIAEECVKAGELRPNVYTAISKNPDVFSKTKENGTYFVELIGKQIENKIKDDYSNHILNIKNGENKTVEFKSTLRWDIRDSKISKEIEFMVIKAITAFLNTDGGLLYIGVTDDSQIIGLESDYTTFKKKNRDGFLLHLNNLLIKYFTKKIFSFVEPNIETVGEKDIAIIAVKQSSSPIFITENGEKIFFIRGTASVQKLDLEETAGYIRAHW